MASSFTCNYCKEEFKNAQALGGHVHKTGRCPKDVPKLFAMGGSLGMLDTSFGSQGSCGSDEMLPVFLGQGSGVLSGGAASSGGGSLPPSAAFPQGAHPALQASGATGAAQGALDSASGEGCESDGSEAGGQTGEEEGEAGEEEERVVEEQEEEEEEEEEDAPPHVVMAAAQAIEAAEHAMLDVVGAAGVAATALRVADTAAGQAAAAAAAANAAVAAAAAQAAAAAEAAAAAQAAADAEAAAAAHVAAAAAHSAARLAEVQRLAPGISAVIARLQAALAAASRTAAAAEDAARAAEQAVGEEKRAAAARLRAYADLGVRNAEQAARRRMLASAHAQAHPEYMRHAAMLYRLGLTRNKANEYRDACFEEDGVRLPTAPTVKAHIETCRRLLYGPAPLERLAQCPLPDGRGITVGCTTLSLRQQLLQILSSPRFAKGSLILLGTDKDAERARRVSSLSAPVCCCPTVQETARDMRRAFEASGLAQELLPYAKSLAKERVVYLPAVVQSAEDASNVSTRASADPCTVKMAFLAPWAQNNPGAVLLGGLNGGIARLKYESYAEDGHGQKKRLSDAVEAWGEDIWLANYYEVSGLKEIAEWDLQGPLLLPEIPGLDEEDGKTLWVVEPGVAGGSLADMMGLQKTGGLQRFRCPRCEVAPADFGMLDKGGALPRSEPHLAANVAALYAAKLTARGMPEGQQKAELEKYVKAGLSARGLANVLPGYAHATEPTWRLPWTVPGSTPFLSRCMPDALHLFKQGLFKYVPASIIKLCESLGTFPLLSKAFTACTVGTFSDSVRTKVTFKRTGINVTQKTLSGPSREWVMRTLVAALRACPACIPDAAQHGRVLRAAEDLLLTHHISTRLLADPSDRQHLQTVLLPRLFEEGFPELGRFQASNFELPKVHLLTELEGAMAEGGSLSNWSMECVEAWNKLYLKVFAFHTSGGLAALHQQLPLRHLEYLFYEHDLWALRGMSRAPLEFTVEPPAFSQEPYKWGKAGAVPTPQLITLWNAAPAGALVPQAPPGAPLLPPPPPLSGTHNFFVMEGLRFTRCVFGLPISTAVLRPGSFVRPSSSRAPDAALHRISLLFFYSASDRSVLKGGTPPEHLPLYYAAEVWTETPGALSPFSTQVRRDSGERVVGRTSSIFGLALTWRPRGLGLRGAVLYDPSLERY